MTSDPDREHYASASWGMGFRWQGSSARERAARALWEADLRCVPTGAGDHLPPWDEADEEDRQSVLYRVDAVLAALSAEPEQVGPEDDEGFSDEAKDPIGGLSAEPVRATDPVRAAAERVFDAAGQGDEALGDALIALGLALAAVPEPKLGLGEAAEWVSRNWERVHTEGEGS